MHGEYQRAPETLFAAGVMASVAMVVSFTLPAALEAAPTRWAEGRILVAPKAGLSDEDFEDIVRKGGGKALGRLRKLYVHIVEVPLQAEDAVREALARNPHIAFAEKDVLMELSETVPNDTYYGNAWHLPIIDAPAAWDLALGQNVTIAILDTGVDATHPDLFGQLVAGWNAASNNADTSDIHGHGTSVAGTAAATSNNAQGVASIAWNVSIMPVRVSNASDGVAYTSTIANALTWAADHGADVANISYSVTGSSTVASAAHYMRSRGGLVVVAAGNSGSDPGYADSDVMISVSATTSSDAKASWSSYGNYVDVAAPGAGIWSTKRGGAYGPVSGTSFASPATAGVVALIMSADPLLAPADVEQILESTADDLGSAGWDTQFGHGRINAHAAVLAAVPFASRNLQQGFNLVAFPVDLATQADLKDWLPIIGDSTEIESVMVYDHHTGQFVTLVPGNPNNPSYLLAGGEALIINAKLDTSFTVSSPQCPSWNLRVGVNYVGSSCTPAGLTAHGLLTTIGDESVVSSIEWLNPDSGLFEAATYYAGQPGGADFPITDRTGYIVNMEQEILDFRP